MNNKPSGGNFQPRLTLTFAALTVFFLFAVNTVGFVDTETGSAFGCGHQWPLCHGYLIPPHMGLHTLIEFSHRGLVPIATIFLLLTSAMALKLYRRVKEVVWLIVIAIAAVLMQAALGAIGVLHGDPPWFLAFHFGISLIALNGAVLLFLVIRQLRRSNADVRSGNYQLRKDYKDKRIRRWTWITVIYIYIEMYFGAYISSTGASKFFKGWPVPTESFKVAGFAMVDDWIHRSLALGLIILSLMLVRMAWQVRFERPDILRIGWTLFGLVIAQALSGAYIVLDHGLASFLVHVSLVSVLFATLCYLALQVLPDSRRPLEAKPSRKSPSEGTAAKV
ncbi:MAG: COX15/CtaA family protein [Alicyclobacillaceae bacterium]|jgi:cytochrome c oxidase assembly protein subunit 15|nr:COX15/CtaA family protein [Alicyclobacillaceae bacterium]